MQNNVVKVLLYGKEVGRLYWDVKSRRAVFSFAPTFVAEDQDIAPLTASIKEQSVSLHPIMGNRDKLYQGLPPFIADSLPDKWGNQVFEQWAFQKKIPLHSLTPVDKLAFIGKRSMGALEFEPATAELETHRDLELNELYQLAQKIFEQREVAQILPEEELSLQSLYEVGTSAGGQHPKAIIAINENTGDIRSGQVLLPEEYTYYILKFAKGDDFPFTNVEMVYYEIAKLASINMMPSRLLEIEHKYHFLTERYDRVDSKKIHTQTLAAMYPEAESYEDLFAVSRMLGISLAEQQELFRRLVFNVLGGNVDDHTKNFSFMLVDGKWKITPAYDMIFTVNLDGSFYENRHTMTLLGKDDDITKDDLLAFAKENDIRGAEAITDEVASALTHFYDLATTHHVDDYWASRIEEYLSHLLPKEYAERMQHYLPTVLSPYCTADGKEVSSFRLQETRRHDFKLSADIDGKNYSYMVKRQSPIVQEIISAGRSKMSQENMKRFIDRFLLPLAMKDKKNS